MHKAFKEDTFFLLFLVSACCSLSEGLILTWHKSHSWFSLNGFFSSVTYQCGPWQPYGRTTLHHRMWRSVVENPRVVAQAAFLCLKRLPSPPFSEVWLKAWALTSENYKFPLGLANFLTPISVSLLTCQVGIILLIPEASIIKSERARRVGFQCLAKNKRSGNRHSPQCLRAQPGHLSFPLSFILS